jgi:hypothetical protein
MDPIQQQADHPIPVAQPGSARFPGRASALDPLLLVASPAILATAFDSLRACGSSGRKIETIRGITEGSTRTPHLLLSGSVRLRSPGFLACRYHAISMNCVALSNGAEASKANHPTYHLFLEDFFSQRGRVVSPFGAGPWPCLTLLPPTIQLSP